MSKASLSQILLHISPPPRNVSETRDVYRAIKRYGQVEMFKIVRFTTTTNLPAPTAHVIFANQPYNLPRSLEVVTTPPKAPIVTKNAPPEVFIPRKLILTPLPSNFDHKEHVRKSFKATAIDGIKGMRSRISPEEVAREEENPGERKKWNDGQYGRVLAHYTGGFNGLEPIIESLKEPESQVQHEGLGEIISPAIGAILPIPEQRSSSSVRKPAGLDTRRGYHTSVIVRGSEQMDNQAEAENPDTKGPAEGKAEKSELDELVAKHYTRHKIPDWQFSRPHDSSTFDPSILEQGDQAQTPTPKPEGLDTSRELPESIEEKKETGSLQESTTRSTDTPSTNPPVIDSSMGHNKELATPQLEQGGPKILHHFYEYNSIRSNRVAPNLLKITPHLAYRESPDSPRIVRYTGGPNVWRTLDPPKKVNEGTLEPVVSSKPKAEASGDKVPKPLASIRVKDGPSPQICPEEEMEAGPRLGYTPTKQTYEILQQLAVARKDPHLFTFLDHRVRYPLPPFTLLKEIPYPTLGPGGWISSKPVRKYLGRSVKTPMPSSPLRPAQYPPPPLFIQWRIQQKLDMKSIFGAFRKRYRLQPEADPPTKAQMLQRNSIRVTEAGWSKLQNPQIVRQYPDQNHLSQKLGQIQWRKVSLKKIKAFDQLPINNGQQPIQLASLKRFVRGRLSTSPDLSQRQTPSLLATRTKPIIHHIIYQEKPGTNTSTQERLTQKEDTTPSVRIQKLYHLTSPARVDQESPRARAIYTPRPGETGPIIKAIVVNSVNPDPVKDIIVPLVNKDSGERPAELELLDLAFKSEYKGSAGIRFQW